MTYNIRKWIYSRMALNCMTAGRADRAGFWYKKLESLEPDNLQVLHNLGVICISMKKYRDAEKYILREISLYGDSEIRYRILGDLYYSEGRRDDAGKAYTSALKLVSAWNTCTDNFLKQRIKICRNKSIFTESIRSTELFEKGSVLLNEGKHQEALECFKKASESDGTNFIALNAAGTVLLNFQKDFSAAMGYFKKALEISDLPLIKGNLSLAELKTKQAGEKS